MTARLRRRAELAHVADYVRHPVTVRTAAGETRRRNPPDHPEEHEPMTTSPETPAVEVAECDYCGATDVPVAELETDDDGFRACRCCNGGCDHTHHDE